MKTALIAMFLLSYVSTMVVLADTLMYSRETIKERLKGFICLLLWPIVLLIIFARHKTKRNE